MNMTSFKTIPTSLYFGSSGFPGFMKKKARASCSRRDDDGPMTSASAYAVLGLNPNCSAADMKAAFRAKVKEFHPDLYKHSNTTHSDAMIRRVIEAYRILSNCTPSQLIESECLDPFDTPECEAFDLFVDQLLCVGKGRGHALQFYFLPFCSWDYGEMAEEEFGRVGKKGIGGRKKGDKIVEKLEGAPHAFTYASSTGTARASSQGHGDDYQVQCAVGQCPRNCIHYVTPSQRIFLEELLDSILEAPYDTSAEADLLYSLINKAKFENNRYQKPQRKPKASSQNVDWF
ncbi:uncharacterized protein HKW66_Vig0074830 [Vigna angularis]|uniref:J domain-containing protein n=1 Tax=Phaseolus angularis TaxID=3914 RepID=A0A8T0K694_PHAAN|nr:uncharacterized protein HKW66_Vig0074830 [Vigna angularis]